MTIDPSHPSPRLLVSVRDSNEGLAVESLPANLKRHIATIDLKEPDAGSLGRVETEVALGFSRSISTETICSAALGELVDADLDSAVNCWPSGFDFVKVGLASAAEQCDWQARLERLATKLPFGTKLVSVAYLDNDSCNAPAPREVIEAASNLGCPGVLFDTFDKASGPFSNHIGPLELTELLQKLRQRKMFSVLAGSVDLDSLPLAFSFHPTMIGVRGAICEQGRTGRVTVNSLRNFCDAFNEANIRATANGENVVSKHPG